MLYRTYKEATHGLYLELQGTWGALEQIKLGGTWLYRRIARHQRCRQCTKPAGRWTGKRVCGCGNPFINKGSYDGFGSLGAKIRHIKKYR